MAAALIEVMAGEKPMKLDTKVNAEDVVRKYFTARNRHSLDAAAEFLDPEYTEYDPLTPEPHKGTEDWRKNEESVEKAIPDFEHKILSIMANGDTVACELLATGTFNAPMELLGRVIPPTGRHIELRMASFYRVNSKDLIAEVHEYYDSARILEQLGLKA
jgi:predicted ester cyclase